ncbi:MAG: isoprenyl transferase [Pseudomonadota bacterium]
MLNTPPIEKNPLRHVAIIMDGNGRWAKRKNLPTIAGHKAGAEAARRITEAAAKQNIEYLTLYTFSSENWRRDERWISELFGLLAWYLENEINHLHKKNVRLKAIGDRYRLPLQIQNLLTKAEEKTKDNTGITVILALSYSGRDEIVRAVNTIIKDAKSGVLDSIDDKSFEQYLDTTNIPDPDLFIRTSGEKRISNYLLWQIAYTELVFSDVLWPDFTEEHFEKAVYEFKNRERRYGLDVA